jgi:thiol:disulfide interchange protein DsbC
MPSLPKIDESQQDADPRACTRCASATTCYYTDEQGNHIVQGQIIDTRTRANLTEARIDKLTAIDFASCR